MFGNQQQQQQHSCQQLPPPHSLKHCYTTRRIFTTTIPSPTLVSSDGRETRPPNPPLPLSSRVRDATSTRRVVDNQHQSRFARWWGFTPTTSPLISSERRHVNTSTTILDGEGMGIEMAWVYKYVHSFLICIFAIE